MGQEVVVADVIEWAKTYQGPKFHALLCDPPYHLTSIVKRFGGKNAAPAQEGSDGGFSRLSKGFMGCEWDGGDIAFRPETWAALGQHLLPGAHLLAFGGTRTWHRLACAIEDAGFELRDTLLYLYGSGFPKSHDVSKGIDRAAGAEREVVGEKVTGNARTDKGWNGGQKMVDVTAPATDAARQWDGWGTALKPAWEPIILARKPLDGTVAQNVLRYGTGALNIDGCRVGGLWENPSAGQGAGRETANADGPAYGKGLGGVVAEAHSLGRWPANVILSHDPRCKMVGTKRVKGSRINSPSNHTFEAFADGGLGGPRPARGIGDEDGMETIEVWECVDGCPMAGFPQTKSGKPNGSQRHVAGFATATEHGTELTGFGDSGSAARFFYCSKASKAERNKGTDGCDHPTIKPLSLLRYLSLLILPPPLDVPRRILVPFAGVGSEMIGARQAGWDEVLGVEISQHYADIAAARLAAWLGML